MIFVELLMVTWTSGYWNILVNMLPWNVRMQQMPLAIYVSWFFSFIWFINVTCNKYLSSWPQKYVSISKLKYLRKDEDWCFIKIKWSLLKQSTICEPSVSFIYFWCILNYLFTLRFCILEDLHLYNMHFSRSYMVQ